MARLWLVEGDCFAVATGCLAIMLMACPLLGFSLGRNCIGNYENTYVDTNEVLVYEIRSLYKNVSLNGIINMAIYVVFVLITRNTPQWEIDI